MINKISFYVTTSQISGTAMSVHMISTILCIIFQNKNDRFIPYAALRKQFDKHSYSKVIISHVGIGGRSS